MQVNSEIVSTEVDISRTSLKYYTILFIIWPFLTFCYAIADYNNKTARRVVFLFLIYFGLTFVNENMYIDAYRYALSLESNAKLPFSEFLNIVGGLYSDTSIDIVEPFLSFVVSRFTTFHGIYFAVWAAIFGYFYLKSINLLISQRTGNMGINGIIVIVFFIMVLPITSISGIRMWTAAWIFFYGAYRLISERQSKYLILPLAATLVHWSFLAANLILIVYHFLGNRTILYSFLAIVSFFAPQVVMPFFSTVSSRLGGLFLQRFEGYSSENYILAQQQSLEESTWYLQIGATLVFYFLVFALIYIQLQTYKQEKSAIDKNLFSFILLLLAFVNFGSVIPTLGGRFQILFFMFATAYFYHYLSHYSKQSINPLTVIGIIPMMIYAAVRFRIGSEHIDVWLFSPLIGLPLIATDLSIGDFLF